MRNRERPAPDIDVRTFGPLDYVRLINRVRGDELAQYFPIDEWQTEIEAALNALSPLRRFIVEARCRGKSLREVAALVGWKNHGLARRVERQAYRLLRTAEKGGPLLKRMREFREQNFCEFETTDEKRPYRLGCETIMLAVKRCKFCRRAALEGDGPRCSAKPEAIRQMKLGL